MILHAERESRQLLAQFTKDDSSGLVNRFSLGSVNFAFGSFPKASCADHLFRTPSLSGQIIPFWFDLFAPFWCGWPHMGGSPKNLKYLKNKNISRLSWSIPRQTEGQRTPCISSARVRLSQHWPSLRPVVTRSRTKPFLAQLQALVRPFSPTETRLQGRFWARLATFYNVSSFADPATDTGAPGRTDPFHFAQRSSQGLRLSSDLLRSVYAKTKDKECSKRS